MTVSQNWRVIGHVKNQTEEACLAAVRQFGFALESIKSANQTEKICLTAVKQNGAAVRHAKKTKRKRSA